MIIFKHRGMEVGRNEAGYYTVGSGREMVIEMAKEIERLRHENDAVRKIVAPYASPASNAQTHELAHNVLKVLGER